MTEFQQTPNSAPVVGLTGGIASGKSTVSERLAELGAHIIDADAVGHHVIAPGGPGYDQVIETFGKAIVSSDGTIDRRKLGEIVFSDPAQLAALNAISHPRMAEMMSREITRVRARPEEHQPDLIVLDAAILFEAGWDSLCDTVWAVVTAPELAVQRLIARNGLDEPQARARLNAQISNDERAKRAAVVIENNHSLQELHDLVDRMWSEITGYMVFG